MIRKIIFGVVLFALLLPAFAQVDMQKAFKECGVEGSITIYNRKTQEWTFSDSIDSRKGTLPASTFKILNTLIALECGAINNENELVKWPGSVDEDKYGKRPNIYHDMNLRKAFQYSAVWVYCELAKKVGKTNYKAYLDTCKYGNGNLGIEDVDFWNFGGFAVSPANQIELLRKIYNEELPFSTKNYSILKDIMLVEKNDDYSLSAKTGWTRQRGKDIGWWIGYVERNDNVYFFATRLTKDQNSKNPDFGACRKKITRFVLKTMKILD